MFRKNNFKYGAAAIVLTVVFIAAVIVINMISGVLTDRFYLKLDLTEGKLFEISDETKSMLANIDGDISITVMSNQELFDPDVSEILSQYASLSGGKVSVRYIDPYINIADVEKYNSQGDVAVGDVVVESAKRFSLIKYVDMYEVTNDYERQTQYASGLKAEQSLTTAAMYVLADQLPRALIVSGHGELPCIEFSALLEKGNYSVGSLNLLSEDIPEDCSLLIINAPETDFSEGEIKKLEAYFERDGSAMVGLYVGGQPVPVLERYLEEWGVRYERGIVMDSQLYLTQPYNVAAGFAQHQINTSLEDKYAVSLLSMPIGILWNQSMNRSVVPLIVSSPTSYAKSVTNSPITTFEKESADRSGPFALAALSEQLRIENNTPRYSRILFYNSELASDTALLNTSAMNVKFFISAANFMNSFTGSVVIPARAITSDELHIQGWQSSIVFWISVVALPLLILAAGIVVWRRRRHM